MIEILINIRIISILLEKDVQCILHFFLTQECLFINADHLLLVSDAD